jgi:hypothetical protein
MMVFLSGLFLNARAATYYVSNNGSPACSNSPGYGTISQPWCTIQYALGQISGGDTIYVRQGTYNENLYIAGPAGSEGANTVISAYTGETVTLYGNGVNTGRCKIVNTSYITFKGFQITNYNQGLFIETSDNILIQNCAIYSVGQEGLTIHYDASYVVIEDCTIHDTRQWKYNGEGIYIGTSDSEPVDNTNNVVIRNSTIYNTPDEGIELKIGTHHITVDCNTIYNVNLGSDWSQNGNNVGAIEANQAVGSVQHYENNPEHIIKNNFIYKVKTAIRAGTGCAVYNNVIWDVSGYGIYVDNVSSDSYTRYVYHNTIDAVPSNAIYRVSGTQDVKNNIGSASGGNIVSDSTYFININEGQEDYHLLNGVAPINAGTAVGITTDKDGKIRDSYPDMGAYEYADPNGINVQISTPNVFALQQNYPNPFNPGTVISYYLPVNSFVSLKIYDILGKEISTLVNSVQTAGNQRVKWDGTDSRGIRVGSGIYFYQLKCENDFISTKKMILLK